MGKLEQLGSWRRQLELARQANLECSQLVVGPGGCRLEAELESSGLKLAVVVVAVPARTQLVEELAKTQLAGEPGGCTLVEEEPGSCTLVVVVPACLLVGRLASRAKSLGRQQGSWMGRPMGCSQLGMAMGHVPPPQCRSWMELAWA